MARTTESKEGKATVKVVYRNVKTLADGSHPFWLRITKNRKTTYIATGHSLPPKYWNGNYTGYRDAIRKSYPEPFRDALINDLDLWEKKYAAAATTLAGADESHESRDVASKANEQRKQLRRTTLLPFMDELTTNMKRAGRLGNATIYQALRNQLALFAKSEYEKDAIRFTDITVKFCNDFETYMRERGNADTSLSTRFRTLRSVLNKAISEGVAVAENYPFTRSTSDRHKFNVSKFNLSTKKRAISRDDLRKVETFTPSATHTGAWAGVKNAAEVERLQRAKDIFLFSFYVGGINFVDLVQLRWRDIITDAVNEPRLTYTRQKTGGIFSLRLVAPALAIIETYRPFTGTSPNAYIFDVLNTSVHTSAKSIQNRLKKMLGQVNSHLKDIGQRLAITTPLTTYVARHTMANTLRQSGVSDTKTSQLMRHASEKHTTVYLDSFATEAIDEAMNALL